MLENNREQPDNLNQKIETEKSKLKENATTVSEILDELSDVALVVGTISLAATTAISYFKNKALGEYNDIILPQAEVLEKLKEASNLDSATHQAYKITLENMIQQTEQIIDQINHYRELLQISAPVAIGASSVYIMIQIYKFLQKNIK